ncbi:MAG: hypothetical protein IT382_05870, partial [Deltaproteobacteria bacterium]|nr:hypothetical protein [Deltaproteobacteria bacterium]
MVDTRSTRRSAHVPARVPGGAPSKAPKKTQATAMQAPTIASDAPTSQGAPTGQGAPANDAPITRRRRGDALPPVVGQELTGPRGALSFAAARAGGEQTFVIRSTEARGMGLPDEVGDALQKLIKTKNSGVRELATAEIGGGGIFSPQMIVSAKGADIKRVLALAGANVEITPLKDLLKPSPALGAADTLGAQLQDVSLGKRLSALSGLQQLAKSGGLAGLDDATKDTIAKGAYAMAQPLIDLFNATLLETTRPRREAIIKAHREAGTTQPGIFNTYLTASAEAMRELRAAGSTPELAALGAQVSSIADVLASLESRQGLALLAALLPHGDGALIGQVRHQPKLVLGLVDQMVTSLGERLAATKELLETPRNQRPQDLRGTSASGGYDLLPGGLRSESARRFSAADPFSGVNTAPLTFLGTDHAPAVRVAGRDALLGADRALPALIAAQEKQHLAEEYQRYQPLIDGAPAAQRAELEASARQQIAENFQPMNAQTDVVDLVRGLSTLAIRNEDVFSSTRAAAETLGLLREVLSGVQTPQMHRLIADAALGALENARKDPALAADAGVRAAADALRSAVQLAGPDPAVRMAAAVRLLDGGDYGALPAAIAALSAKDPELRDAATLAVVRVARAARIATADP